MAGLVSGEKMVQNMKQLFETTEAKYLVSALSNTVCSVSFVERLHELVRGLKGFRMLCYGINGRWE